MPCQEDEPEIRNGKNAEGDMFSQELLKWGNPIAAIRLPPVGCRWVLLPFERHERGLTVHRSIR